MDRIVRRRAVRLGLDPSEFNFQVIQDHGRISGTYKPLDAEWSTFDVGILSPRQALGAQEFSQLTLRSRMDVVFAHEVTERAVINQSWLRPIYSHPHAVLAAPFTPLPVTPAARRFLGTWADLGPYDGLR